MFFRFLVVVFAVFFCVPSVLRADDGGGKLVPRTVLALYDSQKDGDPRFVRAHTFLEMPLNHLGYKVEYRDIHDSFVRVPEHIAAVVVWLHPDTRLAPERDMPWLEWLDSVIESGKKLILFGDAGFSLKFKDDSQNLQKLNRVLNKIGVQVNNRWMNLTFDAKIEYADPFLTGFERKYRDIFLPFESMSRSGAESVSHLQIRAPQYEDELADLIITHPRGGYAAMGYELYEHLNNKEEAEYYQWYINPFRFLRLILRDVEMPKVDVATMNGKRVFYTHLDGDGWNSLTELQEYQGKKTTVAEVLRDKVFKAFPDFPFTVGLIAGEVEPSCYGVPEGEEMARSVLALPNVEPASHSHTHPLFWGFFAENNPHKEDPFIEKYPPKPQWHFFMSEWFMPEVAKHEPEAALPQKEGVDPKRGIRSPNINEKILLREYVTPRTYYCGQFNLGDEVEHSVKYVESLAGGKKVKLYQWSGNTMPFEAAIAETRHAGLTNINGGGSRYDIEFPSYSSIASIGVQVGDERQIYSSNTNENDYTELWTGRFFGFRYLQLTAQNTESPMRVHPYNVYFHSYSAQKQASLNALLENLKYARQHKLFPLFASEYAAMADDFYDVEWQKLADGRWKLLRRGNIQTIRVDEATLLSVDINHSEGILGQRYLHGSLYIALDPAVETPVFALKENKQAGEYPVDTIPYMIESNWKIKGLQFIKNKLTFEAEGFGQGDMLWMQPSTGKYTVEITDGKKILSKNVFEVNASHRLRFSLPISTTPVTVTISPEIIDEIHEPS